MTPRRIRALTKEGLKNLQRGHFMDAILSLRHAMECLKADYTAPPCTSPCDSSSSPVVDQGVGCLLLQIPINLDQTFLDTVSSPHNAFDVYSTAYLYPEVMEQQQQSTAAVSALYPEISTIILYNMGLAHQLAGLSGATPNSQRHLQESLRYYKMALTVFQSQKGEQFFDDSYSLVLGLLNNMGQIFAHTFQMKEAQTCTKHIDLLLASPDACQLSEEDGEFFFGTVLHTRSFSGVVAPAA